MIALILIGVAIFSFFQVFYNLYRIMCEGEKTSKDHNKYITKFIVYFVLALGFSVILNIYVSYFQG